MSAIREIGTGLGRGVGATVGALLVAAAGIGGHVVGRASVLPDGDVAVAPEAPKPDPDVTALVDHLTREEGFRPTVYTDTRGVPTIGYGTTNMTEPEARAVLEIRVDGIIDDLTERWPPYASAPDSVRVALGDMAYQLGVDGLLEFRRMLRLVAADSLDAAAEDALGTLWARQTPVRAQTAARLFRSVR